MKKIACIPAFNEEKIIKDVIEKTEKFVDQVIVCDDGSSDNTSKIARDAGAHVIIHEQNLGKGAAMKTLFDYVKDTDAEIIITIDGDGQFLPEEIPKLAAPIKEKNADIVIGYRFDDHSEMPTYRKMGNKFLDKITNLASELPFRDTQGGFRAYSKRAITEINFNTKGFGVDAEILVDASTRKLKILEEKVTVIYNTGAETSTKSPISHSAEVVASLIELIAIKHPLKYLGIPGIILITTGIILGVFVLITFNDSRYFSIPFTLGSIASAIIGLIFLLMSVVLFSMGTMSRKSS
jgi:glycosyltransferase involved in cell wall biosynthesis